MEELINITKDELSIYNFRKAIVSLKVKIESQSDDTLKDIDNKLNSFVMCTNNKADIKRLAIQIIDIMNYFINTLNDDEKILITKEEFSNRYDKLINQLNLPAQESILNLKTKIQGRPFKVFKNRNNSLVFYKWRRKD